ncbi:hypothetical protein D3C85_91160 [compost metagenome]
METIKKPRISRYSKNSKDLLVDYINASNNRLLKPEQLQFGLPTVEGPEGLTATDIRFASTNGWSEEVQRLLYRRVDINQLLNNEPLAVHVPELTDEAIVAALFEQYGLKLEPELITIELADVNFVVIAPVTDAPGFQDADAPDEPEPLPALQNSNYVVTISGDHLIFTGTFKVVTRQSLTLLGATIDSLLNIRQFYSDSNQGLPPVDLILEEGELKLSEAYMSHDDRRAAESWLYTFPTGFVWTETEKLHQLLRRLTGDEWVSVPDQSLPFNVHGSEVIYNGFVSVAHTVKDPAYNYVFCLDLSKWCNNITGVLKIAYRYSDSKVPGNLPFNHASTQPLFSR